MSILSFNNFILCRGDSVLNHDSKLPPYTLRLKFKDGTTPIFGKGTGTLVDATNNIWDLTYENSDWNGLLSNQSELLEVIGGNTTGVTNMHSMFWKCTSLTSIPLFDTSRCTNMFCMFQICSSLTTIPLFDTSSCTNMSCMFEECYKVQTGALALYQQASTQTNPPTNHKYTFWNCGRDTQTGAEELAQIPSDWK